MRLPGGEETSETRTRAGAVFCFVLGLMLPFLGGFWTGTAVRIESCPDALSPL